MEAFRTTPKGIHSSRYALYSSTKTGSKDKAPQEEKQAKQEQPLKQAQQQSLKQAQQRSQKPAQQRQPQPQKPAQQQEQSQKQQQTQKQAQKQTQKQAPRPLVSAQDEHEGESPTPPPTPPIPVVSLRENPKAWLKTIPARVVASAKHTWHGTKLLMANIGVSFYVIPRLMEGKQINRRERLLLSTTVADILRMFHFSLYIIIPMAEFALPAALKLFPNMLPSTFITMDEREIKRKILLVARIEVAHFLTTTLKDTVSPDRIEGDFEEFINTIKTSKNGVSKEQMYKFIAQFKDDLTLDTLKRPQLQAMCRFLGFIPFGPNALLRMRLRNTIENIKKDDRMIREEGLESLTLLELKQACAVRGMNSLGSRRSLVALMEEWLDLSLNLKVPTAMLILSRAFRLASHQSADDLLVESLVHMPEQAIEHVEAHVDTVQAETSQEKLVALKQLLSQLKDKPDTELSPDFGSSIEDLTSGALKAQAMGQTLADMVTPLEETKQRVYALQEELKGFEGNEELAKTDIKSTVETMIHSLDHEIKTIQAASKKLLDLDSDGLLSEEELKTCLRLFISEDEANEVVDRLDVDHDGYIDVAHVKMLQSLSLDAKSLRQFIEDTKPKDKTTKANPKDTTDTENGADATDVAAPAPVVAAADTPAHHDVAHKGVDEVAMKTPTAAVHEKTPLSATDAGSKMDTKARNEPVLDRDHDKKPVVLDPENSDKEPVVLKEVAAVEGKVEENVKADEENVKADEENKEPVVLAEVAAVEGKVEEEDRKGKEIEV